MVRGRLVLLIEDKMVVSTEFIGDLFPSEFGIEILQGLENVKTREDFDKLINDFNKKNFNYDTTEVYTYEISGDKISDYFNFGDGYSKKWFSDYLYIKNLNNHIVQFRYTKRKTWDSLEPEGILVTYFGHEVDSDDQESIDSILRLRRSHRLD